MKELLVLENQQSKLTIHLNGGAIVDFHLKENQVNPLCFEFSVDQMPENNKKGAPYRGHFVCLGRWGEPSAGEIKSGMPNHGEIANVGWEKDPRSNERWAKMMAVGSKEGLKVERKVKLDPKSPLIEVTEWIINQNPLGRVYDIVQHSTLARPFLDADTLVDCNADLGFDQANLGSLEANPFIWPHVRSGNEEGENLRKPKHPINSVFSFIVNKTDEWGWITAFNPSLKTMIGYVWKRQDFPWIHHWLHYEDSKIQYRGLEFGTAGIHRPFKNTLMEFPKVFGQHTFDYLDSGESKVKKYLLFLIQMDGEFLGVDHIRLDCGFISVKEKNKDKHIIIPVGFNALL